MREIVKKILEVIGHEDVVFVGRENQKEIKTIRPEELELYPRKFRNIIIEDLDQIDEKIIEKIARMGDCLWIPVSMDKLIRKVDSVIEGMIEKEEFEEVNVNKKMEILKKLFDGNIFVANFNLSDKAVVIPREMEKIPSDVKIEPFSSFFLNLSMVEYLKLKLEEVKSEKERLSKELEEERSKVRSESEKVKLVSEELEKIKKEKEELQKRFETEKKELQKRFRREVVRILKEKERLEDEKKELQSEIEEE
ncbi:MAG: hypothetical protein QXU15_03975, partial [Candidatus Aenigmatarchaeota archaeon]